MPVGYWPVSRTARTLRPVAVLVLAIMSMMTWWLVSGRPRQFRVIWENSGAVRAVDDPADGGSEQVGGDQPFPADLGSVGGVGAGPSSAAWGFVQAAVDGDFG